MGSGNSKKDGELTNQNNNGKGLPVENHRNTQKEGRDLRSETTTTSSQQAKPNVVTTGERDRQNGKVTENFISNDSKTSQGGEQHVKENSGGNVELGYENDTDTKNGYLGLDTDGPSSKTARSPVKVKGHSNNLVEFEESSDDDSDTDSLLGIGITKNQNNTRKGWGHTKSEQKAKALNLPLPAPSKQPNHSVVFEQEQALNDYNIQHGYIKESSPSKKPENRARIHADASEDYYPESYAQKLQRDQYRRDQSLMVREKTIHRNPDDWDLEESIVQTFDSEKFKAANQLKGEESKDIGRTNTDTEPVKDFYQAKRSYGKSTRGTPSYNSDDEDLMNEIEEEFDF